MPHSSLVFSGIFLFSPQKIAIFALDDKEIRTHTSLFALCFRAVGNGGAPASFLPEMAEAAVGHAVEDGQCFRRPRRGSRQCTGLLHHRGQPQWREA